MNKTIYPIISGSLPLSLAGISAGDGTFRPDGSHLFVITAGGAGVITADGKDYPQSPGSFCYFPPEVMWSAVSGTEDRTAYSVAVSGSMAAGNLKALGFAGAVCVPAADTGHCENLFAQLMTAAEAAIPSPELVSTLVYAFLLAAAQALLHKDAENFSDSVTASVEYMNRHYDEDITLERLAAISGVSLQHFCRLFRAGLGMRPMEYLARKRVAQAKILLDETDGRVSDIARQVGFGDSNYFGITFRKYEGISPSEYREKSVFRLRNGS